MDVVQYTRDDDKSTVFVQETEHLLSSVQMTHLNQLLIQETVGTMLSCGRCVQHPVVNMTKFYQTCNFFVIGILPGTLCDQPTDVYNNALCILLHFIKRVIFFGDRYTTRWYSQ